jgi:F-type H+-transporting ATPase subunit b
MLVVTTRHGSLVEVRFSAETGGDAGSTEASVEGTGPNPIAPEGKEFLWGAGSFLVFLVLMRLFLYPRLKRGMDARYSLIRGDLESADAVRDSAKGDVARYEAQLAEVRVEAAAKVDAARQTLDKERAERIAEANGRIAQKRAAADAALQRERDSVRDQVAAAVAQVVQRTAQLATGKSPDAAVVERAVREVMAR